MQGQGADEDICLVWGCMSKVSGVLLGPTGTAGPLKSLSGTQTLLHFTLRRFFIIGKEQDAFQPWRCMSTSSCVTSTQLVPWVLCRMMGLASEGRRLYCASAHIMHVRPDAFAPCALLKPQSLSLNTK